MSEPKQTGLPQWLLYILVFIAIRAVITAVRMYCVGR
jgi:hypothetical protein